MTLLPYLERIAARQDLSAADAEQAMRAILAGQASQPQIAAFLMGLKTKGETVEELVGFARAMRSLAVPVDPALHGRPLLDTCGAGGDGAGTFNISTVAAFVVAGAGVHVAKHGNRAASSAPGCGSADLLESLGIEIAPSPENAARAIREVGIGFLFAPALHTAMKHAHPVRVDLRMRTVFNLLGPLTNPAGADAQLAGAPSEHAAGLLAGALAILGLRHGFVVHAPTAWMKSPPPVPPRCSKCAMAKWSGAPSNPPISPSLRPSRRTSKAAKRRAIAPSPGPFWRASAARIAISCWSIPPPPWQPPDR